MKGFWEYMTIQDNLKGKTVSELKEIAAQIGCTGFSRMKKAELSDLVLENLTDPETVKIFLTTINEEEFKRFKKLCRRPESKDIYLPSFYRIGYGKSHQQELPLYTVLTEEIQAFSLEDLDKAFYRNRRQMQKLYRYLSAFVQYYGIIDLVTAVTLLQKYEGMTITTDDLYVDASTLCMAQTPFWLDQNRIISDALEDEEMEELWESQQGKPYAFLPREQLLRYADMMYAPHLPEAEPVCRFLQEYFRISAKEARKETDFLCQVMMTETEPGEVFDVLHTDGYTFKEIENVQAFLALFTELFQQLPLWMNRGFSQAELPGVMAE